MKTLNELLASLAGVRGSGTENPQITGITYDSRTVVPGDLFVALTGSDSDGHRFVRDAVNRGAAAVVHEQPIPDIEAVSIRVGDTRRALSALAAAFYGDPSRELHTIGVTGTDGKSTTVYIIHQLLAAVGLSAGFVSTPLVQLDRTVEKNPFRNSTPESLEMHRFLREMVNAGRTHAVIEATSHGLSAKTSRLAHVSFDCAVFTNLTHEHLEFHGSFEQYRNDKGNLFRALDASPDGVGIVNLDDDAAQFYSDVSSRPVYTYSISRSDADLLATAITVGIHGASFEINDSDAAVSVHSPLPGLYNVSNVLAALLAVTKSTGVPTADLVPAVRELRSLPGRMEPVGDFRGATVLVDYAHTPGAFEKLLPDLRKWTSGKLIVVFGSAGERDVEKRKLQGAVAERFADVIVLTDEDPRGENREAILTDIAEGMPDRLPGESLALIPDRREAIQHALKQANAGDIVALLGKGHESSIIYPDGPMTWDEVAIARECMQALRR